MAVTEMPLWPGQGWLFAMKYVYNVRLTMPIEPFRGLKRPVLLSETRRFMLRNGPFGNLKRSVM